MNRACIIAIGTELTLGQTVDTNSAWLARRLAAFGIRAERHLTVADELLDIRDAITAAVADFDVVLITGGLGPTDDDLTREALAQAKGVELELHPSSLEQIRAFFTRRGRDMPDRNRSQGLIPAGATAIANACGTAPGIRFEISQARVFAMPGVPFEMREMFSRDIEPQLAAAAGGRVIMSRTLHCFGLGESQIGERISDLMQRGRNPEVGTTAQAGVVGIRINATAASTAAARELTDQAEREIRSRLAEIVFGASDDTLASVVGRLLVTAGKNVVTAESCTGGLIAEMLTDISGSSAYFLGAAVAYANEVKAKLLGVEREQIARHGAVSEAVAVAMASGARDRLGATYALSVTGVAGPTGGTDDKPVGLVFIGLAGPGGTLARRFLFGSDAPRSVIRHRAALNALDWLRRELLGVTRLT